MRNFKISSITPETALVQVENDEIQFAAHIRYMGVFNLSLNAKATNGDLFRMDCGEDIWTFNNAYDGTEFTAVHNDLIICGPRGPDDWVKYNHMLEVITVRVLPVSLEQLEKEIEAGRITPAVIKTIP